MVAFDDRRAPAAGFDHIRIDGALGQIVHLPQLSALLLKYPDEFLPDALTLFLRLTHAGKALQETVRRVHPQEAGSPSGEGRLHLVPLVFPQETVVHEDAGELIPHRLRQQRRADGGIHPAGQSQQHPPVPQAAPQLLHGTGPVVLHGPGPPEAADLVQKIPQDRPALFRMPDLRVELHAVETAAVVPDGGIGAGRAPGDDGKALRHPVHIVPVAHPGDAFFRQAPEKRGRRIEVRLRPAVFPGRILPSRDHLSPQAGGHELTAVADAQDGHPQRKDLRVRVRRAGGVDAVGPAGKDDRPGIEGADLPKGGLPGLHLAVDPAFPHPPGDELVILTAEIQDQDPFVFHRSFPLSSPRTSAGRDSCCPASPP